MIEGRLTWTWENETHTFLAERDDGTAWRIGIVPGAWALYAPYRDALVEQTIVATDERVVDGPDALKSLAESLQAVLDTREGSDE